MKRFRTTPARVFLAAVVLAALACDATQRVATASPAARAPAPPVTGQSTMAQTSLPVSLTAKLTKSDSRLELLYSITNNGKTPILVFNRLWRGASGDEPDDEKIYRFVVSRSLRLLLGDAPLPHNPVALRYFPEATRVAPFASLDERITVAIPVTEYNVYFSMTSREQWAADKVDNAELFVRYVDISGGAQTVPSTVHSGAETIVNAEGLLHHKTLRSGPLPISLDVLRQTGEYSRLDLP